MPALRRAVERLRGDLDTQRIVWLEGRHLPTAVTLAPAATVTEVGR